MRLSLDASRATTCVHRIACLYSSLPVECSGQVETCPASGLFFPTAYVYLIYEATYVGS